MLGEDEVANGQVKIKELGLPESNPEKDGVLVPVQNLVSEVRNRLARKARVEGMVRGGAGLRVVGGIRGVAETVEQEIPIVESQPVIAEETAPAEEEQAATADSAATPDAEPQPAAEETTQAEEGQTATTDSAGAPEAAS